MTVSLQTTQHPYCLGIGGIGVSAIARYLLSTGRPVRGSDDHDSTVTDALRKIGVSVDRQADSGSVPPETDLVIYSDDVPPSAPQRQDATKRGIRCMKYAEALAQLMDVRDDRLVVVGTNGKTTTTAWLGWLGERGGLDPTVVVGSLVPQWQSNYRSGQGSLAIAEGDEYLGHFLFLRPTRALITNIEFDHPDDFQDLADVQARFRTFLQKIPRSGVIYANADDPAVTAVLTDRIPVRRFSLVLPTADLWLEKIESGPGEQRVRLHYQGQVSAPTVIRLPGTFNLANAAAAALAALDLGVPLATVGQGLSSFRGTWRRFEIVKEHAGTTIISDYAHHPTAVRLVIRAAREWFRGQTLVIVFQAHHRRRFRAMHTAFRDALAGDVILVPEIYSVPGREDPTDASLTAASLVQALRRQGKNAKFLPTQQALLNEVRMYDRPNHVLLFLGAGDIDQVARSL